MPEPGTPKPRPWGWIVVISLFVIALVVIPLMVKAFGNDGPKEWLDDHYTHVSGDDPDSEAVVYASDDDPATTATDVEKSTDADEKRQETDSYYLRYDSDWMVVVAPDGNGSRIELFEFDEGYRHHGSSVFFWNSHYGRGGGGGFFRGGGSGSGK